MMMKITRWAPLQDMTSLQEQINRIFEPEASPENESKLTHRLPIEVTEDNTAYTVRVMVPGVSPDKINLESGKKELVISYELSPRELQAEEKVHYSQFAYGKFSRQMSFAEFIDAEKIEATYDLGILTVTLPKVETVQRKPIEIKVQQ